MNAAGVPELTAPLRGPRSSESRENCGSWGRRAAGGADPCARDSQATFRRCRWRPCGQARGSAPRGPRPSALRPRSRAQRTGAPARRPMCCQLPAAPPAPTHPRSPAYPARAPLSHPQREVTLPGRGRRGDRGRRSALPPRRPASPRLPHTSGSEPADPGAWAPPTFTPRSCWAGRSGTSAHARSRGGPLGPRCAGAVVFPTRVDGLVPCILSLAGVTTDLGSRILWRPPHTHTAPSPSAALPVGFSF